MRILLFLLLVLPVNDELPELNKKIVEYLDRVVGHTVNRGECWDLAAAALDYANAYLDQSTEQSIYVFGRVIDPETETVYPGDILQFENVVVEYQTEDMIARETMPHHTAIIYEVLEPGSFRIAHQNTRFSGKKVGLSALAMEDIINGHLIFYRPVEGPGR